MHDRITTHDSFVLQSLLCSILASPVGLGTLSNLYPSRAVLWEGRNVLGTTWFFLVCFCVRVHRRDVG